MTRGLNRREANSIAAILRRRRGGTVSVHPLIGGGNCVRAEPTASLPALTIYSLDDWHAQPPYQQPRSGRRRHRELLNDTDL
jgi:hypothetical protein